MNSSAHGNELLLHATMYHAVNCLCQTNALQPNPVSMAYQHAKQVCRAELLCIKYNTGFAHTLYVALLLCTPVQHVIGDAHRVKPAQHN